MLAALGWAIVELSSNQPAAMVGASGGISAVFVLFALNFPHRKVLFFFVIPMPMWVAALIGIGIDLNGAIQRQGTIACTAAQVAQTTSGTVAVTDGARATTRTRLSSVTA